VNAHRFVWSRFCSWARARIVTPFAGALYRHECREGRGLDTYTELREGNSMNRPACAPTPVTLLTHEDRVWQPDIARFWAVIGFGWDRDRSVYLVAYRSGVVHAYGRDAVVFIAHDTAEADVWNAQVDGILASGPEVCQ
jgi:hypothetical protein